MSDEVHGAFIAHAEQDKDTADILVGELGRRGITCITEECFRPNWIDMENISDAVRTSRCAVLLLSEAFVDHDKMNMVVKDLALLKSKMTGEASTIAVNLNITPCHPKYPKGVLSMLYFTYDQDPESPFWKDLEQAIKKPRRLDELLGAGDVAHGLANNYYYGFLKIVSKELEGYLAEVGKQLGISDKVVSRLFVVVPSSCHVPEGFQEYDNIEKKEGGDIKLPIDRAGQMHREYQLHLYRVTRPSHPDKEYYIPMIANSSVDHLLQMRENKGPYGLTEEQMQHQRQVMEKRLQDLVQNCKDMTNVEIILFDEKKDQLSELIMGKVDTAIAKKHNLAISG